MSIEFIRKANYGPPRRLLSDDEVFPFEHFDMEKEMYKTDEEMKLEEMNVKKEIFDSLEEEDQSVESTNETFHLSVTPQPHSTFSRAELLAGQLTSDGDEYIDIEVDVLGEQKVDRYGYLKGGRKYICRTFQVVGHGERLFMLATEVARVSNYRDSYLLFLKNKTLRKIMVSQEEKDDLIMKEIIPYSYRSRQIAIVTARSVFRRFGSRIIVSGKRGKDDYFEQMAKNAGIPVEKYVEDSDRHKYITLPSASINKPEDRPSDILSSKSSHPSLGSSYDTTTHLSILDIVQHAKSTIEFNKRITIQRKERKCSFYKYFYKR